MPQAEQAQSELDRLEQRLRTAQERGKRWQEAWKEAGKGERAALAQAEALTVDAELQAEKARADAREFAARLEPMVRAVTTRFAAGTWPLPWPGWWKKPSGPRSSAEGSAKGPKS